MKHSSLARLTSATNPESGTINYQFDNNGNLTSRTDARSITTTINYDAAYVINGYTHGVTTLAIHAGGGSQVDVLSIGALTDTELYLYWNPMNRVFGPAASKIHVHVIALVAQ